MLWASLTLIMQNPLQRVNDFLIAKYQDDQFISSYHVFSIETKLWSTVGYGYIIYKCDEFKVT